MDVLFHFVMSFAGGYVLLKGIRSGRYFGWGKLFLLSFLVGMIDLEHLTNHTPENVLTHSLIFMLGLPLLLFLAFRFADSRISKSGEKDERFKGLQAYSLVAMVMLIGHLLADMISGIYGIPLLYPLSTRLFLLPYSWNIAYSGSYVIANEGIAVALYFALVFICVIAHKRFSRKG